MIIDLSKCHSCNNCFLACKDEFFENNFPPYSMAQPRHGQRWIDILHHERGQYPSVDVAYLPKPCMQCEDPDCLKAATNEAIYKRDDGIVIIDPVKAKGQKAVVDACPYGVIFWNDELDIPQKCTFCAHLLDDGWEKPRCVQACPTGAMEFVKIDDVAMKKMVETEKLEVFHPEYGMRPRVYYKNLYRFTKCFIAGNVALKDIDECAEGAKVSLKNGNGKVLSTVATNNYGDFRFDGLDVNSGPYQLEVEHTGYKKQALSVDLQESVVVSTIYL
jgi:Fe-S-cluster-containing dehydrogenase component